MTKNEALRLALEALELAHPRFGIATEKHKQAITAIKAALEAKDEPVATKNNDGVTLHLGWDDLPVGTKLYATSPQRKPLTDEEIEKMRHLIDWTAHWSYNTFARAIEAAHGIKEEA